MYLSLPIVLVLIKRPLHHYPEAEVRVYGPHNDTVCRRIDILPMVYHNTAI